MARADHEVSLRPLSQSRVGRAANPYGLEANDEASGYEMLATMDEYEAEDTAVDEARDEPGFNEDRFRAAFRVGYAAGHSAGYAEGWTEGMDAGIEGLERLTRGLKV